jgi:tricarballylate dehydrogenase
LADYDVIVIGAGNAALAAGVSARGAGADHVLVLEKASEQDRGGNTHFSGGLFRFAFDRPDDLLRLVPKAREVPGFIEGIETYPGEAFREDLLRMTDGLTDPELSQVLIGNSYETVCWMAEQGIGFELALSLSAVRVGSVIKWPKGAIVRAAHEGVGLSRMWFAAAQRAGVEIRYGSPAQRLVQDRKGRICGVLVRDANGVGEISAGAVVLGCGGFEANMAWRAQYLGRPWDHARVRGTRHNQGDGLRMAMEIGAMPWGQWSGCHATPINAEAPPYGDRELTDKTNRLSYVYGLMLNKQGLRFVDEGEDQNLYTYAKFGGIILNQPGGIAWQIFDHKTVELLDQPARRRRYAERPGRSARTRSQDRDAHAQRIQRGRRPRLVQPRRARRDAYGGPRAPEIELGAKARHATLLRLPRDRRNHVLVWRREGQRSRAGDRHRLECDPGAVRVRRDGRRTVP